MWRRFQSPLLVRSWQTLSFEKQPAAFVRIVGTHNTANEVRAACGETQHSTALAVSDLLPMIPAGLSLRALRVSGAAGPRPRPRSVLVMLLRRADHSSSSSSHLRALSLLVDFVLFLCYLLDCLLIIVNVS